MFTLSIDTDKGPISILIEDEELYLEYSKFQRGGFGPDSHHKSVWPLNLRSTWNASFNRMINLGAFDLPDNPNIIDVGSGVGTLPLLLSKYLNNPTFFLIDKEYISKLPETGFRKFQSIDNNHGFYNTWSVLKSSITINGFDNNAFSINDVDAEWPSNIDLIISTWSWCWHYPKEVYWNRALSSLKSGGKLQLDISNWDGRDTINEISEELKCIPKIEPLPQYPHPHPERWNIDSKGNRGYSCMWINNGLGIG